MSGRVPRAVYPPREDTALLLPFAGESGAYRVLEIGCGEGRAAEAAARAGARVVATDLNPTALARLRARLRGTGVQLEVVRTDLARGLRRFERVLANPPYLPTPGSARDPDPWVNRALDGGIDGLAVTRRLVAELPDHLERGGRAFVVVSSLQSGEGLRRLRADWRRLYGPVSEVAHRTLEGERLAVWSFERRRVPVNRPARRAAGPRQRTGARRRGRRAARRGSSRAPASGRTPARGGA